MRVGSAIGTVLALSALAVLAHCGIESMAHRRAQRAHDALPPGAGCAELAAAAERFANAESAYSARAACLEKAAQQVVLNFSVAWSLNYLLTVDLSADGRVTKVSPIGAW